MSVHSNRRSDTEDDKNAQSVSESREALIRNLRQFRNQIPRDFKFDREEANSRDREWQSNP
jgi:hypothetical protein